MNDHIFEVPEEKPHAEQYALEHYTSTTLDDPKDILCIASQGKDPVIPKPEEPTPEAYKQSVFARKQFDRNFKRYVERLENLDTNKILLWQVVWGQCSPTMQAKLESMDAYAGPLASHDCAWLLSSIKSIESNFETNV